MDTSKYPAYLSERIRQSLAEDPRTNTLDVEIRVVGDRIILLGQVQSELRRTNVEQVTRELAPETMNILNELRVLCFAQDPEQEVIP